MVRYDIPQKIMHDTKAYLVSKGQRSEEGFVLWSGIKTSGDNFKITNIVIPEQIATKSAFGYSFDIPPAAAAKMNSELARRNEIGLIQVHSHPGINTMHSQRDDKLSILDKKNALSVVLPNFGQCDFEDFSKVSVHIHTGLYKWDMLSQVQVDQILKVVW